MRISKSALSALLFVGGFAIATTLLHVSRTYSATTQDEKLYRMMDLFGEVVERVRAKYVDKPDDAMLIEAALNGMLSSLDPHSAYMSPKNYGELQVETTGEFGGLGLEVSMEKGLLKVVSPIDDTPAARAGFQAKDIITHIDNEPIAGLSLDKAVEKMRGRMKTPVTLTIMREGSESPLKIKVVRDLIRIVPVKERDEGDVAYIKVTSFSEQTHARLVKAVAQAKKSIGPKLKGYVIDLRNNPGGLLEQAALVADDLLNGGAIVITKGRKPEESQRANAHPGDLTNGKPLVVLINGGSASASEIVAGALQDHKRATLVGTRSFGKGSVQTVIPLGTHGALRLTTARYYTPSGRSIQAKGIEPDITIEEKLPDDLKKGASASETWGEASLRGHLKNPQEKTEEGKVAKETSGSSAYVPDEPDKDTQLQYALALLRKAEAQPNTPTLSQAGRATKQMN